MIRAALIGLVKALEQHGAAAGSYLTLRRLARCGPWCEGGHDPVPMQLEKPRFLTHLLSPFQQKKSS
jgi:putative component of membrane protein insertase Oxa1/YidC/SpoIIIJ protein YidD